MTSEDHRILAFRPNGVPGVVTLLVIAHGSLAFGIGAYLYSGVRAMGERVGFSVLASLGVLAAISITVLVMAFFTSLGVVGLSVTMARRRARARSRRGCCLACGYSLAGGPVAACPECATDPGVAAPGPRVTVGHMPALAVAALMGNVGGAGVAEWAMVRDERAFAREAAAWEAAGGSGMYARARAWPNTDCGLVYVPGRGISAHD